MTYTLSSPNPGKSSFYSGEIFRDLDEARDAAFSLSEDTGRDIHITEHFGAYSGLVEVVTA